MITQALWSHQIQQRSRHKRRERQSPCALHGSSKDSAVFVDLLCFVKSKSFWRMDKKRTAVINFQSDLAKQHQDNKAYLPHGGPQEPEKKCRSRSPVCTDTKAVLLNLACLVVVYLGTWPRWKRNHHRSRIHVGSCSKSGCPARRTSIWDKLMEGKFDQKKLVEKLCWLTMTTGLDPFPLVIITVTEPICHYKRAISRMDTDNKLLCVLIICRSGPRNQISARVCPPDRSSFPHKGFPEPHNCPFFSKRNISPGTRKATFLFEKHKAFCANGKEMQENVGICFNRRTIPKQHLWQRLTLHLQSNLPGSIGLY